MAKVTIAGQAVVVTSGMKLDDLKLIKKYRKEALSLYEGEGAERVPVFTIGVSNVGNSINKVGAEFSRANADGYAQITYMAEAERAEGIKEEISDKIGRSLLKLNQLEETLGAVVREIEAEKARILDNIEVTA